MVAGMQNDEGLGELRFADLMTFLTVRNAGSLTEAARKLGVTPSQVSKAVARLEQQFQVELFVRAPTGVRISEAGQKMVPQLEEAMAMLRQLRHAQRPTGTELTVAAPSYLEAVFLPALACSSPDLRLRVLELPPVAMRAFAAENLLDSALTLGPERFPALWTTVEIGEVRRGLFATPNVARRLGPPPVPETAVRALPFITPIFSTNSQLVTLDDGCPLRTSDRVLGHQVPTMGVALEMAVATDQLVFGPVLAAHRFVDSGALVEVRVQGWDVRDVIHFACNSERVLARLQRAFVTAMREKLDALTPEAKS
jgi:DNA-binding transcriptional LysR family regulator